jgi:FlaG/FlaF family flagellin (archaellin)
LPRAAGCGGVGVAGAAGVVLAGFCASVILPMTPHINIAMPNRVTLI